MKDDKDPSDQGELFIVEADDTASSTDTSPSDELADQSNTSPARAKGENTAQPAPVEEEAFAPLQQIDLLGAIAPTTSGEEDERAQEDEGAAEVFELVLEQGVTDEEEARLQQEEAGELRSIEAPIARAAFQRSIPALDWAPGHSAARAIDHDDSHEEARSLLEQPGSLRIWSRLGELISSMPTGQALDQLLDEGLAHLRTWPASLRRDAADAWIDAMLAGEDCPQLRWANRIALKGRALTTEQLELLTHCPYLEGLQELDLWRCHIGVQGATLLSRAPFLHNLQRLNLWDNDLGTPGLTALTRARMPQLRELRLGKNQLTDEALEALASSPLLAGVEVLYLGKNQIGSVGLASLLSSVDLEQLTLLDLRLNQIDDAGCRLLAHSPQLRSLRYLSLASNPISDQGALELLESPHLQPELELVLLLLDLTDDCRIQLANSDKLHPSSRARLMPAPDDDEEELPLEA